MDIDGKKAIVFGGTSGIGLSVTQMLSDKGCLLYTSDAADEV